MSASAVSDSGDTMSGTNGTGIVKNGVASFAAGTKCPRYSASATALAAIAPEKPATNDVQPVRNPASGPYASRRYTYSPPAFGRSAASSAYAIAPANDSAPPTSQISRKLRASGRSCATMMGTKKIPPPMTFETTMAAASSGPRRRSRVMPDRSAAGDAGLIARRADAGWDGHRGAPTTCCRTSRRARPSRPRTPSSSACRGAAPCLCIPASNRS